jgi:ribonuclease D
MTGRETGMVETRPDTYTRRMSGELITDPSGAAQLVERLARAPWIALDTEFLRVDTYYPKLCLLQFAIPGEIVCVDMIALPDIEPLLQALRNPAQPKVIHAARQDLEVLQALDGALPAPVFDTQIAAALVGLDEQIGYGALVEALAQVRLEKQHTRTDWSKRPLSAEQLAYAVDDVRYLGTLYEQLRQRLESLGRLDWMAEECALLTNPALYRVEPFDAWRRIGQGVQLAPAQQTVLRELAAWRERAAQTRNLPRGWVLKDAVLIEIARRQPATLDQLAAIEGVPAGAVRKWGQEILAAVSAGLQQPPQRWYTPSVRLDSAQQTLYQKLAARLQEEATRLGLRPAVLATRQDLQAVMLGDDSGRLTRGWRRAVIGETLLVLVRG